MKIRFLLLATIFSSILNFLIYVFLTRSSFFSNVLFVRGNFAIFLGFIFCWLAIGTFFYFLYKRKIIRFLIISLYSTALPSITLMLFHSLILVSLERSITVYTLSFLDLYYSNRSFTKNDFKKIIQSNYMENTNVASKRISEQINIGYVKEIGEGNYILTKKAKSFLKNSRNLANIFRLKKDFLWPKAELKN